MTRMKESGIDWIGLIPEGWEVSRLKYFFDIYAGGDIDERNTVDEYSENHPYPVISNSLENEGILGYTSNFRFQGDSVTVTGRGDVGKAVYRNIKFYPVVRLLVCIPKKQVDCRFVTYWINSAIIEKNQTAVSQLTIQMLGELIFTKVPYLEQKKIADFLDKKTAQLDKVKALLEEQIQKLKDYRASLIYETVTKGLDKTVPMKDSGIDWIGQVPEGWEVKPIKYVVATPVTDGPHETPLLCETGIPFLSAEAVKNGVLDFNYKRGYISLQDHERFKKKISPKKHDIFIVKSGATTGNVGIVKTDEIFDIWSPLALIRCKESLAVQKYIYYYLISNIFKAQVEFNWSFGTQQNIGMGIIENIKLILPPLSEQIKISDLLDKKTVQIDKLIQIKNEQIKNINKQRQTLIYDYVTGKRRV